MNRVFLFLLAGAATLILPGCATRLGPGAIKSSHRPYNDSVVQTLNEQLLLNLVRLKYRDNPYFIEVSSITAQQSLESSVEAVGKLPFLTSRLRDLGAGAGATYTDSPTITFQPLQGEDFIRKIMAPVRIEAILQMTQSGWSVNRVMRLAVERANHLPNAPTASGPTPERAPEYLEFKRMAEKLRELQQTQGLTVAIEGKEIAMVIDPARISREDGLEMRRLLGVSPGGSQVILTTTPMKNRKPDDLFLQTRSIIGILFYLSHAVEVPEKDLKAGLVTGTIDQDGNPFDWDQLTGDLLKVYSSATPPGNAFVKLRYRGTWFYIADNDLESKSTFMLLNQLFNLLAGDIKTAAPVLTIPLG